MDPTLLRDADQEDEDCVCEDHGNADNDAKTVPRSNIPRILEITRTTRLLKLLPCRHEHALRSGKKWTAAGVGRANSYEAALGYCFGRVADSSCGRSIDGIGPFAECVVVPGYFGAVCVGCHWAGC